MTVRFWDYVVDSRRWHIRLSVVKFVFCAGRDMCVSANSTPEYFHQVRFIEWEDSSLVLSTEVCLALPFVRMLSVTFRKFCSMTHNRNYMSKYLGQTEETDWQEINSRPNSSEIFTKFLNSEKIRTYRCTNLWKFSLICSYHANLSVTPLADFLVVGFLTEWCIVHDMMSDGDLNSSRVCSKVRVNGFP